MPRPRKSTQEKKQESLIELETEIEDDSEIELEELDPRPIATERHRIVREYVKQVPVDEVEQVDTLITEVPSHSTVEHDSPPPHIAKFLSEMGAATERWQMVVYRLPDYNKDNRTDPARRKLCGIMDFSEDYEIEIQRRWARPNTPNHFVVLVKRNGHYIKGGTLPVFSCEPAPPADRVTTDADRVLSTTPADPIYQPVYISPEVSQQPAPPPTSPLKAFKEFLDMNKLVREAFGIPASGAAPAPAAPAADPEVALLQVLAKDGTLVDKLAKSTLGKLLGDGPALDRDPWAEVAMEAVKSGQGAQIIGAAINAIFTGFNGLVQRQQPESPAPVPEPAAAAEPAQLPDQPIEMQVLSLALDHCARSIPAAIAAQRIMNIADEINEKAPAQSIDGYLSMFANMDVRAALDLAQTLTPNGSTVAALPHAEAWTAELQGLLQKALEVAPDGEE